MAKSFAERINDVMSLEVSNDEKSKMLVNLGLPQSEVWAVLYSYTKKGANKSPYKFTFGVEMEVVNCKPSVLKGIANGKGLLMHGSLSDYNHRDSSDSYKIMPDGSLIGVDAMECVSPVLDENGFASLEKMCASLDEAGADVNKSCGLHVHIGAKDLSDEGYVSVFVNYKMMERVIDTFMAKSRRANEARWCRTLQDHDFSSCHTKESVRREMGFDRYHKVNAESYLRHQTIEFRQHQGSINYEKISMWVNFCAKLVKWSRDNRLARPINSIDEIPFLSENEKEFFKARAIKLA